MNGSTWNSLEVVKIVVALLTPVFVAVIGFWLNKRLKSLEQAQWSRQKIVERRIRAYDELAGPLNEIYCFYCYVGGWKELKPPAVIELKRGLDQAAHVTAPLFDHEFLVNYNALMDLCFAQFGGWGDDAKLRTLTDRREQTLGDGWDVRWNAAFVDREKASSPADVKTAYWDFMAYLARSIGADEVNAHLVTAGPKVDHPRRLKSRPPAFVLT